MGDVSSALRKAAGRKRLPPPWAGPGGEGPQGGVTQGLLSRYLSCKERFRVLVVDGLKTAERFNPALDFGNLWHACEEALAKDNDVTAWVPALLKCEEGLARKYPMQRGEVAEWAAKARALFPKYVEHWSAHPDVEGRTPLLSEQTFDVPYALPSGRTVRLRGKVDSADAVKGDGVWVQENKSKSGIDGTKITRQLTFDLQTMTYLIAVRHVYDRNGWAKFGPLKGVRYNVVRRAAHKTVGSMLEKFETDRRCGRVGEWFARWNVEVTAADVAKFKRECLDPVLENLCDDWEWWSWCKGTGVDVFTGSEPPHDGLHRHRCDVFEHHHPRHFRMPYCGYNPLAEGGFGDVDEYLATGSEVGLRRAEDLFPELKQE